MPAREPPRTPAEHGRNSSETAVRQDALYLDMPMDVPMVHLVANIARGRIWIEDRGWKRRALRWSCNAAFGRQRFRCFGVRATYGAARGR